MLYGRRSMLCITADKHAKTMHRLVQLLLLHAYKKIVSDQASNYPHQVEAISARRSARLSHQSQHSPVATYIVQGKQYCSVAVLTCSVKNYLLRLISKYPDVMILQLNLPHKLHKQRSYRHKQLMHKQQLLLNTQGCPSAAVAEATDTVEHAHSLYYGPIQVFHGSYLSPRTVMQEDKVPQLLSRLP